MPTERLSMRRIRQILQLHFGAQASARVIARELGVARSTVQGYLARVSSAELGWPLPADLADHMLEERLFPPASLKLGVRRYVEPDWAALAREMKRAGVNLIILWEEYQQVHPEGYGYSRYVAARLMWRRGEKGWFPWHEPQHNFERRLSDYRAFRNIISDGNGRCHGFVCRSEISTRASAFAFISMSTSA
jgi:hypothetical protein